MFYFEKHVKITLVNPLNKDKIDKNVVKKFFYFQL